MWLHYLIFFYIILTFMISKAINTKNSNKIFLFLNFIFFLFLASLRDVNVGNDTIEYYRIFDAISSIKSIYEIINISRYELGYLFLNFVITRITNNFNVILFVTSFIYLYSVFKFIERYADSKFLAIILFFTLSAYYLIFNIQRQCIAIAIFLYAIRFLEEKKYVRYISAILVAASFHYIAIILIFLCFVPKINIYDKKITFKYLILSCFFAYFIADFIMKIGTYIPYFGHYITDSEYSKGGVRIASIVLVLIRLGMLVFLSYINGFKKKNVITNREYIFNYIAFLDCVVSLTSIKFNLCDRVEDYFCIIFIVMIANAISYLDIKTNRDIISFTLILVTMLYLTISLSIRSNWYGIFPYKFI